MSAYIQKTDKVYISGIYFSRDPKNDNTTQFVIYENKQPSISISISISSGKNIRHVYL
jgi:hypothetical protein